MKWPWQNLTQEVDHVLENSGVTGEYDDQYVLLQRINKVYGKKFHAVPASADGRDIGHIRIPFHEPAAGQSVSFRREGFVKQRDQRIFLFHHDIFPRFDLRRARPALQYLRHGRSARKNGTFSPLRQLFFVKK